MNLGRVQIRLTDSGEACCLEQKGGRLSMARMGDTGPGATERGEIERPLVEVTGPARVIQSILDGKKDAAAAFAAGGLMVRGDLVYLEALLNDYGLLKCEG
jgi:hypothetical protein